MANSAVVDSVVQLSSGQLVLVSPSRAKFRDAMPIWNQFDCVIDTVTGRGSNCPKDTSSSAMSELKPGPVKPLNRTCIVEAGRTTVLWSQLSAWCPLWLQSVNQPFARSKASTERVPIFKPVSSCMW